MAMTFIRKPTRAEKQGGSDRQAGFVSIPKVEGSEIVYRQFGEDGSRDGEGYYYVSKETEWDIESVRCELPDVQVWCDGTVCIGQLSNRHSNFAIVTFLLSKNHERSVEVSWSTIVRCLNEKRRILL